MNESKKLKRGHIRNDGLMFWAYASKNQGVWLSPEAFFAKKKHVKERLEFRKKNEIGLAKKLSDNHKKYSKQRYLNDPPFRERKRRATADWRKKNPTSAAIACKKWRTLNKHTVLSGNAKRRAEIEGQTNRLSEYEKAVCDGFYADALRLSKSWGIPWHVDHIVPISKGGKHHPSNLQLLPAIANLKKGAKIAA